MYDALLDRRKMSWTRGRNIWETATAVTLAAYAALIVFTFRDYGVTVDEEVAYKNGKYFINWFASGFHDRTIIDEGNQRLYGSFFNAISAFVADHSPFGVYDTGHLVIAITSFIGVVFAYRLGKRLAGPMAGFFSALLLLLTPLYYGHSFMNPKDIPFATMFLVCIYYFIAAYDHLPRLSAKWVAIPGTAIGLTLGIRVGAVMLFGYLLALIALWLLARYRNSTSYRGRIIAGDVRAAIVSSIGIGLVAWVVMLVWWPYGQISPILNPLRALKRSAHFTDYGGTTLYRGRSLASDALPWHYLPTWFSITLPEFYGLILSVGVVTLLIRIIVKRFPNEGNDPDRQSKMLFLVFATFFPVATAMVMRPILYDANRHFLFVVPPLAVLSGIILAWLLTVGLPSKLKIVMASLVSIIAATTLFDMTRLHPYEYVLFNRSFGGLHAALGRYETDYWGVSHKEGIDWLIANYEPNAPAGSIRVANTAAEYQTSYYLSPRNPAARRFTPVAPKDRPDVMLSITRFDVHLQYPGKVLHVVERQGTPLLYVVELNPGARPAAKQ